MSFSDIKEKIFRRFLFNKLVRDNVVPEMIEDNCTPTYKQLDDKEFENALKQKFVEEALELSKTNSKEELLSELADCMEVLSYIKQINNISDIEIEQARNLKNNKSGNFDKRYYIIYNDASVNSKAIDKYYKNAPEKYPEIPYIKINID